MARSPSESVNQIQKGKPLSFLPHTEAIWVDLYNSLVKDIQDGKYRNHDRLHRFENNIKRNALLNEIMHMGFLYLKENGDHKLTINIENLPTDLVTFLKTDMGQKSVNNILLKWFSGSTGDMMQFVPSSPAHSSKPQEEEVTETTYVQSKAPSEAKNSSKDTPTGQQIRKESTNETSAAAMLRRLSEKSKL